MRATAQPAPSGGTVPSPSTPRRRLGLLALVLAAILVLGSIGVYLAFFSKPGPQGQPLPPYDLGILVSPSVGNTTTVFAFTAQASDAHDNASAIQVRWDFQNDGVWDTSWSSSKNATHVFPTAANFTVRMEARNTANLTANATRTVLVQPPALVYYEQYEPVSMDPADSYDLWSFVPEQNVYDTLIGFSRDTTEFVPDLATSWVLSASRLNFTFHLRQGVRFCDGQPFTSNDVYASLARVLIENSPTSGVAWILSQSLDANDLRGSMWVIDPYTIQLNMTAPDLGGLPYDGFLSTLAMVQPAGIMEAAWINAHGGVQHNTPNYYITQNTMGTGPYCMNSADWVRGSQMTLHMNPYYWRGWSVTSPRAVRIVFTTNPSTRVAAITSGAADVADLPLSMVSQVSGLSGVSARGNMSLRSEIVAMNLTNPYLADNTTGRLVREAFSYAFDYNATIAQDFGGFATPLPGPIPAGMPFFSVQQQLYYQSLSKANQLLNDSGYLPDNAAYRFGGYAFRIVADGTQLEETNAARRWQTTLTLLGVKSVLVIEPSTAMWDMARQTASYDFFFAHWYPDYVDPDDYVSPMVLNAANFGDYWNTGYNNLTANVYGVDARSASTDALRAYDYTQVVDAVTVNPNMIWYAQEEFVPIYRSTVTGFFFNPATWYNFYFYGFV